MRKFLSLFAVLVFCSALALAQTKVVSGKVTDQQGQPVPYATIKVKDGRQGTSAGSDGSFKITVPENATLVIGALGYVPQEFSVSNTAEISASLMPSNNALSEVVVTSLGIKREKRALTYSTQEIKGDVLVAAKQDNVINGLAGKVSGVQVTNSTGMPGSSSRIVIRGATSLTGQNEPLFVVDGVPIDNSEAGPIDALGQGAQNVSLNQGSTSNRGIDIDPNIIESVNILKGAAATALYGAAASSGAIIITTKNGSKTGPAQVSVSSSYSLADPILYPVQTTWAQGSDGVFFDGNAGVKTSGSWGPRIDTLHINGVLAKKYNQQKLFFNTGHTFDNNVSISGATDKSKYLMSYSYLKNNGITPGTDFTRHSIFGKFSNQLTKNITANFQLNYINSENNRAVEGNGLANPLWTVFSAPATWNPFPITEPDGSQQLYRSLARNNPYYALENAHFVSKVNRFLPVASFVYNPLPWMSITERVGADVYSDESHYHEANGIINGFFNNNGGATNRVQDYRQFNNDLIIEVHKDLSKDLFGSFLVGTNLLSQYSHTYVQTGQGGSVQDFYNISNFTSITAQDIVSQYRKVGFYAQANLEYRKFLYLALTGRYDGTSVLAPDNAFYPYGSAALGFVFTELLHINPAAISFGKIRASISAVGNDDLPPYSLTTNYLQAVGTANNISYPFNGQNAFVISNSLGNPRLTNERLREYEFGLEMKFLNNRLSFEGSYFDRTTSNLLTPINPAPSSGYYVAQLNAGSIENKGFELLLTGSPVKTKNFSWDVSANFTKIKNNVIKLAPGVANLQIGGFGGGGGIYAFPGHPYGVIYGSLYLRDDQKRLLLDDDGDPIKGDNGIIGNINPDFLAGITNTFTYKSLSLSFLFDWKQHGDIYNLDDHYNWFYGTPKSVENRADRIIPGIIQSTGKANTTAIGAQEYFQNISDIDEAVVEDATYIKLRNVSLSYSINATSLKRTPFRSIVITASGNNLWIYHPHYSGSDPETSLQGSGNGQGVVNYLTPTSRNYVLGVKLVF